MQKISSICVFCGARNQVPQKYLDMATRVGEEIAGRGYRLIYGGGDCGLMGAAANGALKSGGHVTGVFPTILQGKEAEHHGLSENIVVGSMHARKQLMFDKADAFFILPGGFGTMDETFEIITWKQLNVHEKPVIIFNYEGYWNHLIALMEHFFAVGFASDQTRKMYKVAETMGELFEMVEG